MKFRHGEILIEAIDKIPNNLIIKNHLILAEGETTGHKHEIITGEAELCEDKGILYLKILTDEAELVHPDHKTVVLPKGDYKISIQKEYEISETKYRNVKD